MHRPKPSTMTQRRLGGSSVAILFILAGALAGCGTSTSPGASTANSGGGSLVTASPASSGGGSLVTAPPSSSGGGQSAPPGQSATAAPGGGNAAAWCAFVIEINTKYGLMKDKVYSVAAASAMKPDIEQQLVTEAVSRGDEWLSTAAPEIRDGTAAEIAYYQQLKAWGDVHGWTDPAGFPRPTAAQTAAMASLVPYQTKQCGITLGK